MKRRDFIIFLGSAVVARALPASAQQPSIPVIGFLNSATEVDFAPQLAGFRQGLQETGYTEGRNVAIEFRWGANHYDRLPALAAELVRRQVAVLVATGGTPSALAAEVATATIPIVFTTGGDPIALGLATNLNRPTGNATGVSLFASTLAAKRLELLHKLFPTARVIAMLVNPDNPGAELELKAVMAVAPAIGLQIPVVKARTVEELDKAFAELKQQKAEAVLVSADPFLENAGRDQLLALAAQHSIPTISGFREGAVAGALASYGSSFVDAYRQAGIYTGRILKGEKPSDLPVLQPAKFEFVINLKTAKALGLTISNEMQLLADEVIE
jgi:putative tryptophan/tyrosine transport system substrate-binding protein